MIKKEYLIWVNFGAENGSPKRVQDYYKICSGETIEDVIQDWVSQNEFKTEDISYYEGRPFMQGRHMTVIELLKDNGFEDWKTIKWVSEREQVNADE